MSNKRKAQAGNPRRITREIRREIHQREPDGFLADDSVKPPLSNLGRALLAERIFALAVDRFAIRIQVPPTLPKPPPAC